MGDLSRINPNNAHRKHLENLYYLKFMLALGTMVEKHRASIELEICERKLKFWKRRPGFDHELAQKNLEEIKKIWKER